MPVAFTLLGLGMLASETILGWRRRSQSGDQDQGSLRALWLIVLLSIGAAMLPLWLNIGPTLPFATALGAGFFLVGAFLRWWSIVQLGRFFTVNVAVANDHRIIDDGPYRWVRHPSYTGLLFQFAGLGFCLGKMLSPCIVLLPIVLALRYRIRVEEAALLEQLGPPYRDYCAGRKRLLPGVW